jgi:hypothetical protein
MVRLHLAGLLSHSSNRDCIGMPSGSFAATISEAETKNGAAFVSIPMAWPIITGRLSSVDNV